MEARRLFDILHGLGYSKKMATSRASLYNNAGNGVTIFERKNFGGDFDIVIGGSRGDGTGVYLDCDVDKIFVLNGVKCLEREFEIAEGELGSKALFTLETDNVPKGYARLCLSSVAQTADSKLQLSINKALEAEHGRMYLRNDYSLCSAIGQASSSKSKSWLQTNLKFSNVRTGPAEPYKIRIPLIDTDIELDEVLALRCLYPSIINQWCERVKNSSWPSNDLIEKIKTQEIYVVPVGVKGHKEERFQWRICLNLAELLLVLSFTDTQIKIYVALKMVAKHYLKPICNNITSYVIKNAMFWLMESGADLDWEMQHFTERLQDVLWYLKQSLTDEKLLNYMIPARNMLENKVTAQEKVDVVKVIDSVLCDVGNAVLRCHQIAEITTLNLEDREQEYKRRKAREEVVLALFSYPPESVAMNLRRLFDAQTEGELVSMFSDDIFSHVRKNNPFDYFQHLPTMGNKQFYSTCEFPGCVLL